MSTENQLLYDPKTVNSIAFSKIIVNGVVVEYYKSPDEFIEGQPLLKLAQVNPLNVEVIIPMHWLRAIKKGMTVQVYPKKPVGGSY